MGKNPESIGDMEIYDIITELNKFPFIQTSMCCSGHYFLDKEWGGYPFVEFERHSSLDELTAKIIVKEIQKDIESKKDPIILPRFFIYSENPLYLRILGKYDGNKNSSRKEIEKALSFFWGSFRDVIHKYKGLYNEGDKFLEVIRKFEEYQTKIDYL